MSICMFHRSVTKAVCTHARAHIPVREGERERVDICCSINEVFHRRFKEQKSHI